MKIGSITVSPTAVDADGVCQSQNPAAAGDLTINGALASGGVATFGAAQLVTITAAGNEAAFTFTVYGTDADGRIQSEDITGPNATTVTSTKYFKTVTRVAVSGDSGAITVGNAITAVSPTVRVDHRHSGFFGVGFGCVVSNTITYGVQHTFDDYEGGPITSNNGNTNTNNYPDNWFDHESVTAKTASDDGNYAYPVTAIRIRVTASTSGSVTGKFLQAGA